MWEGAGGQLSIGTTGTWCDPARTHLVLTGVGIDPPALREVFETVLLTDAELARGLGWWAGRPDGLDPWLGSLEDVA